MGNSSSGTPWWHRLNLDKTTAQKVAERGTKTPEELAMLIRAAPEDFRNLFGIAARRDLEKSIRDLQEVGGVDEGLCDLVESLEEADGRKPMKAPTGLPHLTYGAVFPPMSRAEKPEPRPLPKLPKLGPGN